MSEEKPSARGFLSSLFWMCILVNIFFKCMNLPQRFILVWKSCFVIHIFEIKISSLMNTSVGDKELDHVLA